MYFFVNIAATFIFLVFSRCFRFVTLRERSGYGGARRYSMDYLEFVMDDIHWFTLSIVQAFLFVFSLIFKHRKNWTEGWLLLQVISIAVSIVLDFVLVFLVFFCK